MTQPCMTDEECQIIQRYLDHYRPARCLEWGTGWSTVVFSNRDWITEWVGIEHNAEWIERLRPHVPACVRLYHSPMETPVGGYATPPSIDLYVNHFVAGPYDFIFIDGDYRIQCLEKAATILSERGFCFVHDTARKYLHDHFHHFRCSHVLTPGEFNSNNDWHQGLTVLSNWDGFQLL